MRQEKEMEDEVSQLTLIVLKNTSKHFLKFVFINTQATIQLNTLKNIQS
jgi:hypothetical protein